MWIVGKDCRASLKESAECRVMLETVNLCFLASLC